MYAVPKIFLHKHNSEVLSFSFAIDKVLGIHIQNFQFSSVVDLDNITNVRLSV